MICKIRQNYFSLTKSTGHLTLLPTQFYPTEKLIFYIETFWDITMQSCHPVVFPFISHFCFFQINEIRVFSGQSKNINSNQVESLKTMGTDVSRNYNISHVLYRSIMLIILVVVHILAPADSPFSQRDQIRTVAYHIE